MTKVIAHALVRMLFVSIVVWMSQPFMSDLGVQTTFWHLFGAVYALILVVVLIQYKENT